MTTEPKSTIITDHGVGKSHIFNEGKFCDRNFHARKKSYESDVIGPHISLYVHMFHHLWPARSNEKLIFAGLICDSLETSTSVHIAQRPKHQN